MFCPKYSYTSVRSRVWFYYIRRDGNAQVVMKVEHRGGESIPKFWVGPFPTHTAAALKALDALEACS